MSRPDIDLAKAIAQAGTPTPAGLFNPYRDLCRHDLDADAPASRLVRLAAHLDCQAEFILAGEAPGYQGCRYSGVAFTSERLLGEGVIPRIPATGRLTDRERPYAEPSATIVWSSLYKLGLAETTILWNAVQMHPHRPGEPLSNRTPTEAEVALGATALRTLVDAFPKARLVAVGRTAEEQIARAGLKCHAAVRHPANGGATKFFEGLKRL